jgi:hypothetical protein
LILVALLLSDVIAWRDALIQARLSGVRMVRDAFRSEVQYANDAEMKAALQYADRLIATMQSSRPINAIRFTTTKGL